MVKEFNAKVADPKHWVDKYADHLYNYAICRINDEEIAKDLVQETFLAALEKINSFEGRSSEKTWLIAIIKNKIIDIYRNQSKKSFKEKSLFSDNTENFFEASDGHWKKQHQPKEFKIESADPLLNKELKSILQSCMKKLPSLWFSVFTMKHMDDASTDLICEQLNVSASNFWVIIHRTKVNLRACVEKNWI